jgi:hypothetical protein
MRYFALTALVALSACAPQGSRPRAVAQSASPSSIIAADIAFNRLASEKGQWTAFRETAARDAIMFVPEPVEVQVWLKSRANPAKAVKWQPYKAFMACDGQTGVTTGAFQQPDGKVGTFTTVWQWQAKRKPDPRLPANAMQDGEWKLLVNHTDVLPAPLPVPEIIETKVASCKGRANAPLMAPPEGAKMKMGLSRDQSLNYTWIVMPDNSRTIEINLWNGQSFDTVQFDKVAAPKK